MNFQFEENGRQGRFFLHQDGRDLAEIVYRQSGDPTLIIDHTEVDDSLAGQGVGKALVLRVVELARANQQRIQPLCPFAKKLLERDPAAYADVLQPVA